MRDDATANGDVDQDVLAFDVGGANVKAADGRGWARSEPFELWRRRQELAALLRRMIDRRRPRRIIATMTGEIADCYASRSQGVADIVAAVVAAAGTERDVGIYRVDGAIVSPDAAAARPLEVAAANWHALARLAGASCTSRRGLLIDVGSTTTDVVPLADGGPAASASDDLARMAAGELVYTGIERTPVAALVRHLPWRGRLHPVASELFAQSRDVWMILGGLPERPDSHDTADGGSATCHGARRRLARMLLADPDDVTPAEAAAMAERCAARQTRLVARAVDQVVRTAGWRPEEIVLSGHGDMLIGRVLDHLGWKPRVVSLAASLGDAVSRVAPAHALALIARGEIA